MKKYLVILISGIIIGLLLSNLLTCERSKPEQIVKTETITITKVDTVQTNHVDTVYIDRHIRILADNPVVKELSNDTVLSSFPINNKFFNGNIRAYSLLPVNRVSLIGDFKLKEIHHFDTLKITKLDSVIITKNIQNYKYNHFYLGTTFGFNKSTLIDQDFKVYYTNRKIILGAGLGYNYQSDDLYYKATLGIKIFNNNKNK